MPWIETEHGFVNLDHVVQLQHAAILPTQRDKRPTEDPWTAIFADGTHVVAWVDKSIWLPDLLADVVPAAAGQEVLVISADGAPQHRPTEADIWVTRYPVIAWRVVSKD